MLVGPDTKYVYVHINDVKSAIGEVAVRDKDIIHNEKFLIGNSKQMITTKQFFELMAKHTGVPCPQISLNLTLGFILGWILTLLSTWITGWEPIMPIDIMRTALWGGIEYECSKSEEKLGIQYTDVDVAVRESVEDVRHRLGICLDVKKD